MENIDSYVLNESYEKYIKKVKEIIKENSLEDKGLSITDTPLSPMLLKDDNLPIMLMPTVGKKYKEIVSLINDENKATALEYGFILLGKVGNLKDIDCCVIYEMIECSEQNLNNKSIVYSQEKINEAQRIMIEKGYNFISLAHTHPKTKPSIQSNMLASYLPEDIKQNELIRETGLNISLQDIISYKDGVYEPYKESSQILTSSTIIMFNGEIVMFSIRNGELVRYVDITDLYSGDLVYVSNANEYIRSDGSVLR